MEQSPSSQQPEPPDPVADARRLVAEHERLRLEACAAEIEQVLSKYGMHLDVAVPQISIVPN